MLFGSLLKPKIRFFLFIQCPSAKCISSSSSKTSAKLGNRLFALQTSQAFTYSHPHAKVPFKPGKALNMSKNCSLYLSLLQLSVI